MRTSLPHRTRVAFSTDRSPRKASDARPWQRVPEDELAQRRPEAGGVSPVQEQRESETRRAVDSPNGGADTAHVTGQYRRTAPIERAADVFGPMRLFRLRHGFLLLCRGPREQLNERLKQLHLLRAECRQLLGDSHQEISARDGVGAV